MRLRQQLLPHHPASRVLIAAAAAALAAGAVAVARAARGLPEAMGAGRASLRAESRRSAHAVDGSFTNSEPAEVVSQGRILRAFATKSDIGKPAAAVPLEPAPARPFPAAELAVTWYGHASALFEIDGHRVLADPMWGERASPSPSIGPRRLHPVPVPLSHLPAVDAVVISHDHYDHLDLPTIRELCATQRAPFVVPIGIGAHLRGWGIPADRIVELDWGGTHRVGALTLTCARARHFSGRGRVRNTTQWAAWALAGPRHRAFFGGDTGYTSAFAEIAGSVGRFDLTVMPIGAYADLWPDVHMTPEEAVRAHLDLASDEAILVPVHWATFDLAFHAWAEPVERLVDAAKVSGVRIAIPRPGGRVDVTADGAGDDAQVAQAWWRSSGHPQFW